MRDKNVRYVRSDRYVLITPLVSEGWDRAVLVNRGWVPAAWRDDAAVRAQGEPSGQARPHILPSMSYS